MKTRLAAAFACASGLAWLGATSCYAPVLPDCAIRCGPGGDCPDGMSCSNAYCSLRSACPPADPVEPEEREAPCVAGAKRCASPSEVERCSDESTWVLDTACDGADPACYGGKCQACVAGSVRCESSTERTWCDESGAWQERSFACPAFAPRCVHGACLPELAVTTGGAHACALTTSGVLECWGDNAAGQLGTSDTARRGGAPDDPPLAAVDLGARSIVGVSAGGAHTCALLDGGSIACFGQNASGQLGLDDRLNRGGNAGDLGDALATVDFGVERTAVAVSAGGRHTCALFDDGQVVCFGANEAGQLGRSAPAGMNSSAVDTPWTPVPLGRDARAIQIDAGEAHNCALLAGGSVACWGSDEWGQLGTGGLAAEQNESGGLPAAALPEGVTAVQVSAGGDHSCALLSDASIVCWGSNAAGQLGIATGEQPAGAELHRVDLGQAESALAVSAGAHHTCALLADRRVRCWGANHFGTLGLGTRGGGLGNAPGELDDLPPVDLGHGGTAALATTLGAGTDFSCVALGRAVQCFGANGRGQLGVGDTEPRGDDPNELGAALPYVPLSTPL